MWPGNTRGVITAIIRVLLAVLHYERIGFELFRVIPSSAIMVKWTSLIFAFHFRFDMVLNPISKNPVFGVFVWSVDKTEAGTIRKRQIVKWMA